MQLLAAPVAAAGLLVDAPGRLPSHFPQRRPDAVAAEHGLGAASADIGVVRRRASVQLSETQQAIAIAN